jgi:hypothetical protein
MLRDGSTVFDARLDRLVQFDPRSRSFPIRALVADKPFRSYTWSVGAHLNQGAEGACVGFAFAHELNARPMVTPTDNRSAREAIYWESQKIDEWPGGSYPDASPRYEGTSILAGAKVCQNLGHFAEYRWAFSLNDLLLAIGYAGPAVLGINWYSGMFGPDSEGRIRPTGSIQGGHAILANRVAIKTSTRMVPQVWLWNSWGPGWGMNGACWLTFEDLDRLLHENGEACIPVMRRRPIS